VPVTFVHVVPRRTKYQTPLQRGATSDPTLSSLVCKWLIHEHMSRRRRALSFGKEERGSRESVGLFGSAVEGAAQEQSNQFDHIEYFAKARTEMRRSARDNRLAWCYTAVRGIIRGYQVPGVSHFFVLITWRTFFARAQPAAIQG